jgi:hypothetical protein
METTERMKRVCTARDCLRLLVLGIVVLSTSALSAQSGFVLTSPTQRSQVIAGQPVTVTWTGGDPAANVNLVLIDLAIFQVVGGFGIEPEYRVARGDGWRGLWLRPPIPVLHRGCPTDDVDVRRAVHAPLSRAGGD